MADDLVFVLVAGARAGDEDFPVAVAAHPHGVAPAVPEIEIADHADAARVGREHHEGHAIDAFELHRMGAELVVELEMRALAEQMQIEIAEDRREAISVLELDFAVAESGAQPIVTVLQTSRVRQTAPRHGCAAAR